MVLSAYPTRRDELTPGVILSVTSATYIIALRAVSFANAQDDMGARSIVPTFWPTTAGLLDELVGVEGRGNLPLHHLL